MRRLVILCFIYEMIIQVLQEAARPAVCVDPSTPE